MEGGMTEKPRERCLACQGAGWHMIVEELDPTGWTPCLACDQTGWADSHGDRISRPPKRLDTTV